jgi:hypothetical protein
MTDSARATSSSANAPELPCEGNSASSTPPGLSALELGLGVAWILLPSIQYYATTQRTGLQLEGNAALPGLASTDMTPFYVLLMAATLILAVSRRLFAVQRRPNTFNGGASEIGQLVEEDAP